MKDLQSCVDKAQEKKAKKKKKPSESEFVGNAHEAPPKCLPHNHESGGSR